jgi:hypothetical protein
MSTTIATFTLPIAEARTKAREVINCAPTSGIIPVVENWHLVSDGQIEFTVRNLQRSD